MNYHDFYHVKMPVIQEQASADQAEIHRLQKYVEEVTEKSKQQLQEIKAANLKLQILLQMNNTISAPIEPMVWPDDISV
jgi:hypothetical protein